jgi:phage baseplate assembly protein W
VTGAFGSVPSYPLRLEAGRTAPATSAAQAAEELVEQLLLTAPGERLNRPTLGAGLLELVFDAGDDLRAATQFQIMSGLQQWAGDRLKVIGVIVYQDGDALVVDVEYQLAGQAASQIVTVVA